MTGFTGSGFWLPGEENPGFRRPSGKSLWSREVALLLRDNRKDHRASLCDAVEGHTAFGGNIWDMFF